MQKQYYFCFTHHRKTSAEHVNQINLELNTKKIRKFMFFVLFSVFVCFNFIMRTTIYASKNVVRKCKGQLFTKWINHKERHARDLQNSRT